MFLIFICSTTGQQFQSDQYDIVENKGVVLDENGNRGLDARVRLNAPCPHCGAQHTYHVAELVCPFLSKP